VGNGLIGIPLFWPGVWRQMLGPVVPQRLALQAVLATETVQTLPGPQGRVNLLMRGMRTHPTLGLHGLPGLMAVNVVLGVLKQLDQLFV
jgi:hypothetical protein